MSVTNIGLASAETILDENQVQLMSLSDMPLFDELHAVLKKHGALRRFGVALLHQHFRIDEDEVMLERSSMEDRTQFARPVKRSFLNESHIATAWRLDTGKPISVMNCVPMPDGSHQERHSDIRLKHDIRPLNGALDMILALQPSRYDYRCDEFVELQLPEKPQIGVMAQDVALVLPELVHYGTPGSNYLSVDYIGLVPVLVGAIKEQQAVLKELQRKLADVEKTISED